MTKKWVKVLSREGVDITTISGLDLVFFKNLWNFTKAKEEDFFTYFHNKNFTHYTSVDPQEWGRTLYKKYFNSPAKIKKYYTEGEKLLSKIRKNSRFWSGKINKDSYQSGLLKAYKEFGEEFKKINHIYSITSWLAIESWQKDFDELVSKLIESNKLSEQKERIMSSLYLPWKKTALQRMQEDLSNGKSVEDIVKDYQFLRSWAVVWNRPIDEAWVKNIQQGSKGNEKIISKEDLLDILKPDAKGKKFLAIAPYIIFFKDWRDDLRREHCYLWSFLFEFLADKFSVEKNDLGYLTLEEIKIAIKENKIPTDLIEFRKKNPVAVTSVSGKLEMRVVDARGGVYATVVGAANEKNNNAEIKGLIAQGGLVKGRVIIIKSFHDVKKVNEGDILIANTTHPNYLPAMQKAAAFVTNEGGVISHAAIVAREMKKPCIVGTKIATQVLKDGDMVEVDANKGIVKIIK